MTLQRTVLVLWIAAAFVSLGLSAAAQTEEKYRAHLAHVPALRGVTTLAATVGDGNAAATLSGKKLSVTGSFEKLASAATTAHLYLSPVTGVRGTSVFDLTVTKAATNDPPGISGTFAGSFDLNPEQIDALKKGRFYVQLHSTGSPTGHLRGWLLK